LERLIEAAHAPHVSLKRFAAMHFKECFRDFPALAGAVMSAIYDLCEDDEQAVRMRGYEAVADVSLLEPRYVRRNVDVLVQLLQNGGSYLLSLYCYLVLTVLFLGR
jgi:hypothetical protein